MVTACRCASLLRALAAALVLAWGIADGAPLGPDRIAALLPPGQQLGERDARLPVWPLLAGGSQAGYVFQSEELEPVPGYAGSPVNLLIVLDMQGRFVSVRVLHHNEPVFVDGLGPEPLERFVAQYAGRSAGERLLPGRQLDGVSRATVSVRVINETVLGAALKVARTKLRHVLPLAAAGVRPDVFEQATWRQMVDAGWVRSGRVTRRDLWLAFLGTASEGWHTVEALRSDETFVELHHAYLNVPSVGRNLLGEEGHRRLLASLAPGEHAIGVFFSGGYGFEDAGVLPRSLEEALALKQGPARPRLLATHLDFTPRLADIPPHDGFLVFAVDASEPFDASEPWSLALRMTRTASAGGRDQASRDFDFPYSLPARFFAAGAPGSGSDWPQVWRDRVWDLAALLTALVLLSMGLLLQRELTADARRFTWVRRAFLVFTLAWLGWSAQGQLSIVNLLAVVQAVRGKLDLSAYLYAPVTVVLWTFVLISLLVWGRATYCGWLCPFGVLQEFAAAIGKRVGVRRIRVPEALDLRLQRLKYAVLGAIVVAALFSADAAERMSEVEPFRTAINLGFQRHWPYVLWALAMVLASMFVFKAFCRWLCPLGAALALLGRARRWNWLERRAQCGAPCQLCRHRCDYKAIARSGAIRYDECFQCMDCVVIHNDRGRCAPLMLEDKRARREGRCPGQKCSSTYLNG